MEFINNLLANIAFDGTWHSRISFEDFQLNQKSLMSPSLLCKPKCLKADLIPIGRSVILLLTYSYKCLGSTETRHVYKLKVQIQAV